MHMAGKTMLQAGVLADTTPMQNYIYESVHGHIVVNIEGRPCLLDTGSPFSLGYEVIYIAGQEFPLHNSYLGVTCDYLTDNIGVPIEGLIGADIVQAFTLSVFSSERTVQFSERPAEGTMVIAVQNFMGVPIIPVAIGGRVMRMFFDTGAPMSYLLPDAFVDREPDGRHEDFYPLLGNFLTNTYSLGVNIGGEGQILRFGELPDELGIVLEAGKVQGILGTEMLKHFGMCLSLREGMMKLDPLYNTQPWTMQEKAVG
jgi:hypothetical protein